MGASVSSSGYDGASSDYDMAGKRYLIIGDGAAGTTAAQYLRTADPKATIAIISDDPHAAYFRAALTNYLLGELREEQIFAVPPSFYDEFDVHRALARVAQVDTQRSQLLLAQGGRPLPYDALVVAAGSRARAPVFDGWWLPGVMTMRTLQDVRNVMDLIKLRGLRHAVIVGGGPLGLEWAHGLSVRGVKCTAVIRDQKFMPAQMDDVASDLLHARLKHSGVDVRLRDEVVAVIPGQDGRTAGVQLKSGARIACQLVGVGIGVVCNSEFLQNSGIELAKNGGVVVNDLMRTNVPNVYAAGDIAAVNGSLLQLWEPAKMQARVVAANISGREERYAPGVHYMATRVYDLDFAALGESAGAPQPAEELVHFPRGTGQIEYRKVVLRENRVVGALMLGEREARVRRHGRALKTLIDKKIDITKIKGDLLDPTFDLVAWLHQHDAAEKPKTAHTMASAAKMRGTNAINLADLPPLPVGGKIERKAAAAGTQAFNAFGAETLEPPRVFLQGPPGRIEVKPPSALVGRDPQCQVPLTQDVAVSHVHAEITITGQAVYVRDLGSSTGTWVNGNPCSVPKRLRNGDKIRIGSTELVVALERAANAGPESSFNPSLGPATASEPTPHLDVRSGRSLGLAFELFSSPTLIGRDPAAQIRLDDEWIDWQHAFLRKSGTNWELSDAQSHGVTKKNGVVLEPGNWVPLAAGDVIEVGQVVLAFSMRHAMISPLLAGPKSMVAPSVQQQPSAGHHPSQQPPPPQVSQAPVPSQRQGTAQSMQSPASMHASQIVQPVHQVVPTAPSPGAVPQRRARLQIRQGPGAGSIAELAEQTIIGSDPRQCTLAVPDPYVGPRHVEIMRHPTGFFVRDLGTQTGTQCRGQRLGPQPFPLQHGDVIVLGANVALLFEQTQ
jgi:NADPH-dependent 2,4-dienoyl-CoA reductase/sulfur reductase-like enzyme/pSer/pThr/pTyr-binding forkhead associated (FHA) protein